MPLLPRSVRRPPDADALTVYRPLRSPRPAAPRGQLARGRDGRWWYRTDTDAGPGTAGRRRAGEREDGTLPALLRPDLDHALRRRVELLARMERADHADGGLVPLVEAFCMVGSREIVDLETGLHAAHQAWRASRRPGAAPGAWIPAPRALARVAESLRPGGGSAPVA
ncbi:hypothetical protein E4198_06150 [Streptomyces sp. RKND-216]|uniref:hypothetical protein n=1 Tax=Streptomyces sp. RKND-216 TaxID=2562581 RepID=UPI00109DC522|nr:hypothetical protein [Streptomyces sp. RKND-216]THA24384.1 hypothetical protein E4198_06150 [Streptomyces sp. RKND-216]